MYFPECVDDYRRSFQERNVQDHERVLFEYYPVEDYCPSLELEILKVADMTIKMVDAIKLRLGRMNR